MGEKTNAFAKGGCGCLAAFLVVGVIAAVFGGNVFIDLGGALLLFVVGGAIGLLVLAVYQKGRRDAGRR